MKWEEKKEKNRLEISGEWIRRREKERVGEGIIEEGSVER